MEGAHAQNLVSSNKTPGEQHCKTNHTQFRASARIHHLEHTHTRANTHARARANEFPICFRTRACAAEISLSHLTFIIYSRASRATTRLLSGGRKRCKRTHRAPSSRQQRQPHIIIFAGEHFLEHYARTRNVHALCTEPEPELSHAGASPNVASGLRTTER